jgi:hypothetical protein
MRCLTGTETQHWIGPMGLTIKGFEIERIGNRVPPFSVKRRFSGSEVNWSIAEAIVSWLPHDSQRFLWLSHWETYPPGQVTFVEALRRGCGESRSLFETPGHLFEPVSYSDYDARSPSDICEESVLAGLVLLVLSLEWDATFLSKATTDSVFISDGYALFSSDIAERVSSVPGVADFGVHKES